jgi:Ca2+-binding EF-hand superfamily protein
MLSSIDSSLASTWTSCLFAKLDTQNQGYIDKAGLESAFSKISDSSNRTTSADDIFAQMDSNNDSKVTKDELTSQLKEIGSSDSKRSALITKIINNFDKADTNGDGKVSFQEAVAYDQANQTDTSTATASSAVSATDNQTNEAAMMK